MDVQMIEQMIQQNKMKNHQIKQAGVDGIINKKLLKFPLGRGIPRKIPLHSALWITYNGMVYMFIWIWLK